MAGIINHAGQTGLTTYAVIRDSTGQVWNGSTFEAFAAGNWSTYDVSLIEQSTTGYYKGSFPSGISAGIYHITIHVGSVLITDEVIGQDSGYVWDGTSRFSPMSFTTTQKTQINTEVLDVVNSQTMAELTTVPGAEATLFQAVALIYQWLRNDTRATATVRTVRNSNGDIIGTSAMSDDGTTFSQGKLV